VIEYVIDPNGHVISKKQNGSVVSSLLWEGSLRPAAMLDAMGAVTARFVYATGINVPNYMIKNGVQYRFVTDRLGSVRAVVNVSTGEVVQKIEYDAFGKVLSNSNADFQPFGFAGGLYESKTGLVRFGARDYDANVGRWTKKDPIGFNGGDANLFTYCQNNPVNFLDPTGLKVGDWWDVVANAKNAIANLQMQIEQAKKIAYEEREKRPSGHNDGVDAMRHAEWNRRMTTEINPATACAVGIQHEVEGLTNVQPFAEAFMDLYNNTQGIMAGVNGVTVDSSSLFNLNESPLSGYMDFRGVYDNYSSQGR